MDTGLRLICLVAKGMIGDRIKYIVKVRWKVLYVLKKDNWEVFHFGLRLSLVGCRREAEFCKGALCSNPGQIAHFFQAVEAIHGNKLLANGLLFRTEPTDQTTKV